MRIIDVFNGDADGLCALHQLRLADPAGSELVTGVKRETALLARVEATDARITVLDISLETNRSALERLLEANNRVRYFDHHFAGVMPSHPLLEAHIDTVRDQCTSTIVDRHLTGRFRAWAIVGAFGDNLDATARHLAATRSIAREPLRAMQWLGAALNYNAYGETIDDLVIAPAALYGLMRAYADPLAFAADVPIVRTLDEARRADLAAALAIKPLEDDSHGSVVVLPGAPWSRRVLGACANHRVEHDPGRAHAILAPTADGLALAASVRTAVESAASADSLCRAFPTGGGRTGAAGINRLPRDDLDRFIAAFRVWSATGQPGAAE